MHSYTVVCMDSNSNLFKLILQLDNTLNLCISTIMTGTDVLLLNEQQKISGVHCAVLSHAS